MDPISGALADLSLCLRVAADTYTRYARRDDSQAFAETLQGLAHERSEDAARLHTAAIASDLALSDSTLSADQAAELISLGSTRPPSGQAVAFRVQRAENTLGRLVSQLRSVIPHVVIQTALGLILTRLDQRQDDVRDMRAVAASTGFLIHEAMLKSNRYVEIEPVPSVPGHNVRVWFATNRTWSGGKTFTSERAATVQHGSCDLFVPNYRNQGSMGSSWPRRLLVGDDRIKLSAVQLLDPSAFWTAVGSTENDRAREALIHIHGYNTTFALAARRTAQLKVDLLHEGPTAFFAWPSFGKKLGYTADEAAIEGSEGAIRQFLIEFAQCTGVTAVHIIAHSMGNRGLLRAVDKIANGAAATSGVRFGQIILAAPDVDSSLFQQLAGAYGQLSRRSTLYVAENDRALGLSKGIHQFARAGRAPPVLITPGIDTVNVTRVNMDLLGHGYATELAPVLNDIRELLLKNTHPNRRDNLRSAGPSAAAHWEFV